VDAEKGMKGIAWLLLAVPALAWGAGWTDVYGDNAGGERVVFQHTRNVTVQKQGDEEAYVQHVKADIIVVRDGARQRFPDQDCVHSYRSDGRAWLTCSPEGKSPLAGVTYHQQQPAGTWVCWRHCRPDSPAVMTVSKGRMAN
jgi:hypothetical protein